MKREIAGIDFGSWIKEKRKLNNLNQEQLADLVKCHTTSVGRWERGEQSPPLDITERIVKAFGAEIVIRERNYEEREID